MAVLFLYSVVSFAWPAVIGRPGMLAGMRESSRALVKVGRAGEFARAEKSRMLAKFKFLQIVIQA